MKKILLLLSLATTAYAVDFKPLPFLNPSVFGPYMVTNAACSTCYTQAFYGGITVGFTNATFAGNVSGGFTNINSWLSAANGALVGTNAIGLTWTNHNGIWVLPTNNTPGAVSGLLFVTNDASPLVQDIPNPIPSEVNQSTLFSIGSTNGVGLSAANLDQVLVSPYTISVRLWGASSGSQAGTLNFIFVGLPDGVNEPTSGNTWQWGVTPAAGNVVIATNFPAWRFIGCSKIRLRSVTPTTYGGATQVNTIQSLTLNGPIP
jgi:hypothetical protein